jgi:hypothetical protein
LTPTLDSEDLGESESSGESGGVEKGEASSGPMTEAVLSLPSAFDTLSEAERQEAAVEILRRVSIDAGELPEQALVEAADELFCALDAEVARDGYP